MPKDDVNVRIGATDKSIPVFKSAEGRMKRFAGSAKNMVGGLTAILGTRAIIGLVNDTIQFGSALTDAATATNTNIEALQIFRAAARDAGAEQSKMENAMVRAHKAGVDAANGLSTYTRAFEALNINIDQYNKLPTEKKLEAIALGMKNAKDQNAAYAAAMDIMGTRNAPKLMEVLQRLGKDGYSALRDEITKTNNIMSETDAQQLDQAADAIARLQQNLTVFTGDKVAFWLQFFDAVKNGREHVDGLRGDVSLFVAEVEKAYAVYKKIADLVDKAGDTFIPFHRQFSDMREKRNNPEMEFQGAYQMTDAYRERTAGGRLPAAPPPPVAPPKPEYDAFAESGDEAFGLKSGEWVKISAETLAELQKAKELQAQTLQIVKDTNAEVEKAQAQASNERS